MTEEQTVEPSIEETSRVEEALIVVETDSDSFLLAPNETKSIMLENNGFEGCGTWDSCTVNHDSPEQFSISNPVENYMPVYELPYWPARYNYEYTIDVTNNGTEEELLSLRFMFTGVNPLACPPRS